MRSVLTLLPVWKKNPNADFTPTIEFPDVFRFIERIQSENRWTFSFEKTEDIETCLSIQFSAMLRELLNRSRACTLDPITEYSNESEKAQRIAREKPKFWEFLLTAELIKSKLADVRRRFDRQKTGLTPVLTRLISGRQFMDWVTIKMQDLVNLTKALDGNMASIQASWGPPGKPGDVHDLKNSVDDFIGLCYQLVEWEKEVLATTPPESLRRLKETMKGWTEVILLELERLPEELLLPFQGDVEPKGQIEIILRVKSPSFDNYYAEIANLRASNPGDWLD